MPVLHFRLDDTTQLATAGGQFKHQVSIDHDIHGQNFTFIRAMVSYSQTSAAHPPNGVIIDCGDAFFQGPEVISNFSSNSLMIPITNGGNQFTVGDAQVVALFCVEDIQYNQDFSGQDIKRGFTIIVRNWVDNQTTVQLFGGGAAAGQIEGIDLFFSFDQLEDPDVY